MSKVLDVTHRRELFTVGKSFFETREEAEEYRDKTLEKNAAIQFAKLIADDEMRSWLYNTDKLVARLNNLGFSHDGVER